MNAHIKYTIPVYNEADILGEFVAIKKNIVGDIVVIFKRKEESPIPPNHALYNPAAALVNAP
jgi:hypothetical protein